MLTIPEPIAKVPNFPDSYGISDQLNESISWSEQREKLEKSRNYWICSTRSDGRPHSAPVWGIWMNGTLYFATGIDTRKAINLRDNPAVSVHLESGDDVIILEGTVTEERDLETLTRFADLYNAKYNFRPEPGEVSAITYTLVPTSGNSWLESDFPNTATRWIFSQQPV